MALKRIKCQQRLIATQKDDDLGAHALWMKEEFCFEFTMHFWKRTHFWCDMGFGTNERTVDVFRTGIVRHSCRFNEREDGIYFSINDQSRVKNFDWQ